VDPSGTTGSTTSAATGSATGPTTGATLPSRSPTSGVAAAPPVASLPPGAPPRRSPADEIAPDDEADARGPGRARPAAPALVAPHDQAMANAEQAAAKRITRVAFELPEIRNISATPLPGWTNGHTWTVQDN
jgi:hypothetical protein